MVNETGDLKIIIRNGPLSVEWEDSPGSSRVRAFLSEHNGSVELRLRAADSPPQDLRVPVTIRIPPGMEVDRIESVSQSSSLDLRLAGAVIRTLEVTTGTGSNYIELSGCTVEAAHIESAYGRSYLVAEYTTISSDLSMKGNPVEEHIAYYDRTAGAVHLGLSNCSIGGMLCMESVAGKIELYADDTTLNGGVGVSSNRAMQYLDLWDCSLPSGAPVTASSDRGRIELRWAQHEENGEDMTFDISTGGEDIYFRVWGPFDINRYDITALTGAGLLEFHSLEDFNALEGGTRYRSKNYDEPLDLMTVHLRTDSREIYARVVDCYKPLRFCGDFKVMKPMDPPF